MTQAKTQSKVQKHTFLTNPIILLKKESEKHRYKIIMAPNYNEFRFPADRPFPFRATGLDVFGPFASKTADQNHKRYALIFTCLTTRAVHLEMCPDVSTAATINALRRFFARCGTPVLLVSDNATNFVAADNDLVLIFKSSPLQDFLANKEIK